MILKRFFCQTTNSIVQPVDLWKNYLRRKGGKMNMSLINEEVAKATIEATKDSYLNNDKIVFEATPGAGILTKQILKSGAKRVRVFQNIEERHKNITIL